MSLPPITIPLLDPAGPVDPDNDLLLIRQGLNDRKVSAGALMNPRLGVLQMLQGQLTASDVLLIGKNNGLGGYDNYIMPPQYLGFLNGTSTWFNSDTAPLGWTIVANSGDKVLATVKPDGETYQYKNTGYQGDWQQLNHTLDITQMPYHSHTALAQRAGTTSNQRLGRGDDTGKDKITFAAGEVIGHAGGLNQVTQGHNHGFEWRPAAVVGVLCVKNKLVGQ